MAATWQSCLPPLLVFIFKANLNVLLRGRLQAVPFWIVERSREIAEREKTGANLAPLSLRYERTLSTDQKGTACSLALRSRRNLAFD